MKSVPIVDEQDTILYHKNSSERDIKKEIMRFSALWLLNEKGQVLISLRSKNKKSWPNFWSPSVTGTNEEGESYESNIKKETEEELGVKLDEVISGQKDRCSHDHEYFCQWFFATVSSTTPIILQKEEVDAFEWLTIPELEVKYKNNPEIFIGHFDLWLKVLKQYADQN